MSETIILVAVAFVAGVLFGLTAAAFFVNSRDMRHIANSQPDRLRRLPK